MMRITEGMALGRTLLDLQRAQSSAADTQHQVSTGQRINSASDDPVGIADALRRRDDLGRLDTYDRNATDATSWLQTGDTSLQQITDSLHRVQELTVQGANAATDAKGRQAIADEIGQIVASIKDTANARIGDQYIFGGTATTPPYSAGATDAYGGDSGVVARTIGPGVSVQVNVTGGSLLGSGGGDGKLLDVLRTIQANLTSGNTGALGTTDLQALSGQVDAVSAARATLGTVQNRVDAASDRISDAKTTTSKLLDDVQNVDMAEALTRLSTQQTALTIALKASGSVLQGPSLMDFLTT
jgi:flagellar hook-associated protein 3 FlgL